MSAFIIALLLLSHICSSLSVRIPLVAPSLLRADGLLVLLIFSTTASALSILAFSSAVIPLANASAVNICIEGKSIFITWNACSTEENTRCSYSRTGGNRLSSACSSAVTSLKLVRKKGLLAKLLSMVF